MNIIKTGGFHNKGQTLSIDSYLAIGLFLTTVVAFYSFISLQGAESELTANSEVLVHRLRENVIFEDDSLSEEEEARLVEMNCTEIKELFESKLDICIYFRDSERNVVPLTNGTIHKLGVGCEGVEIGNKSCGTII
ncbi:MAG: hypothetical protein ACOCQX_00720 [Candidatus Nanoarchaeia archaeon]